MHAAGIPVAGKKEIFCFRNLCLTKKKFCLNIDYNILDRKVPEEDLTKKIAKPKGLKT